MLEEVWLGYGSGVRPAVGPWVSPFTSLCLSFLSCKMMMVIPTSEDF